MYGILRCVFGVCVRVRCVTVCARVRVVKPDRRLGAVYGICYAVYTNVLC